MMKKAFARFKLKEERTLALKEFWRRYKRNRGGVVGLAFVSFIVFISFFGPSLAPYNPWKLGPDTFEPPSAKHLFGTDDCGRDVFSGVLYGARVTMICGLSAAAVSAVVGSIVGALSGYYGGKVDDILMRATEVMMCLPVLILCVVLVAILGGSLVNLIAILSLRAWTRSARLVRGEFLSLKGQDFTLALKSFGASSSYIIFRELLPNALHITVVQTTLMISISILMESTLSFLGLGDPSVYTWGYLLKNANPFIRYAWWMSLFPGLFVMITVLGFNLMGDGLNDALNPRLR